MIQRLQSIYLFLAGILAFACTFLNDYAIQIFNSNIVINFVPSILLILSGGLALATIFLYKKRVLQIKLVYSSALLTLIGLVIYIFVDGVNMFYLDWQFYFMPLIILALTLAKRGIQNDEDLIRSSNRLR